MRSFRTHVHRFLHGQSGTTTVEYAVMLSLIITVCVGVILAMGINSETLCRAVICKVYGPPSP